MNPVANVLTVSGGLIGGLAIAGFIVAVLAALVTPILARASSLEAWRGPLKLVPYALLGAGGILAGVAAILGTVTAPQPGVREIAAAALTILCLTPLIGAIAVRLRFGAAGGRARCDRGGAPGRARLPRRLADAPD
ncbi:MAG TPA: hypothetical protein VES19_12175 [Candidatus Limnocylindrales bacterium]|nr:hypothetical protein [Candidatus Limnocylindrales bacterium]